MAIDVLIVGAGPAAWSCALTCRQRNLETVVTAAENSAGWLSRAERIDNYPGMPAVSGRELLSAFRAQAEAAGARIVAVQTRMIQQMGSAYMALVGNDIIEAKTVVLCLGAARPQMLPGEEENLGMGVSWCGTCDGMFYRGKKVAVISWWDGGVEEGVFLSGLASRVDYYPMAIHAIPEERPFTVMDKKAAAIVRNDRQLTLQLKDGTGETYDGIFLFRPNTASDKLLSGLQLEKGFITVNRKMETSLPGVFAAGDCTGQPLQIAKAVGEGNIAAISAAEYLQKNA